MSVSVILPSVENQARFYALVSIVAWRSGCRPSDILSQSKARFGADARLVAYWIAQRVLTDSPSRLADRFGKDRSTVIKGAQRVDQDPELKARALDVLPAVKESRFFQTNRSSQKDQTQ